MPSPARPRHVAFSHKQKKLQLQTKRALKRGEEIKVLEHGQNGRVRLDRSHNARSEAHDGLELFSRFIAVPRDYVVRTRDAAWDDQLPRPIPDSAATFPLGLVDNAAGANLSVPSRPPFKPGQTKREVEQNEEALFQEWFCGARNVVEGWVDGADIDSPNGDTNTDPSPLRSPSSFETNLEVWRQLWRVVEASSIILLLVDARCPPVHCPPSLRSYLRSLQPRREIILVLTKADLVDPDALAAWRVWLKQWWMLGPSTTGDELEPQVVSVSSYDTSLLYGVGKARNRPHIPDAARLALLDALQIAHARLLSPPSCIAADPDKLASWKPHVRESVHWGDLEADAECVEDGDDIDNSNCEPQLAPLTLGLVGQPNVGKSSLLNALLGETRARASRTPGKTKHWQTMLWGQRREVRIVDCPGLVCPSLVPMELQALSGILPIAQIPSLPACIAFAAKYLPLERIFNIPAPEVVVDDIASRRTWRAGYHPPVTAKPDGPRWTAGDIMDGRATDRGFMTAKSARPDANRAADGMMRSLAEGRVRWCFWPPNYTPHRDGSGLWLGQYHDTGNDELSEGYSTAEDSSKGINVTRMASQQAVDDLDTESSDEDTGFTKANQASFFAALSLDDGSDGDDDE
ncbi:hypothetical protein CspeluHIS016_0210800 [Cutaneotrichosporon spelunceum]|uniref:Guanine nucleotide-binding protein-like 1 n=1 Tax=Cutaneotrichosporon spelunceum TaxID=1672016 RepID=A0AAD3TSK1_9TREE|nr:hypothetical protein CspeluHIS016_0210800 [Cutaneotrichosporon spelunceum]